MGSITVWLVSSFLSLDKAALQHANNNILSCLVKVKSNLVELETSCTVILPPPVSGLLLIYWLFCLVQIIGSSTRRTN